MSGERVTQLSHRDANRSYSLLIATGLALVVLLGLGTWQLQRKVWKDGLLADIHGRALAPPLGALPAATTPPLLWPEYRRVALTGRFDHGGERHVFISVPGQANGIGGPGYWVFTPFATGDQRIYVNRGFVPMGRKAVVTRLEGQTETPVTLEGVLRRAEPRGTFSAANSRAKNEFYVRSPREFATDPGAAGISDLDHYIDLIAPLPPGGLPLPMVGRIAIPNRHLEYAMTWYALAATLLIVAFARGRVRPHE